MHFRSIVVSVLVVAPAVLVSGPAGADAVGDDVVFRPHRAVYDLKLDRSSPGGAVANVTGRVVYELLGSACEGYAQNMRFVTETSSSEGESEVSDLRTASWEDAKATRLRFNSSTYSNERLSEQTQGTAAKQRATANGIDVGLSKPAKKSFKVATPAYFPIEHSMAVVRAARAKKTIFAADLYDGSENGEKVYATTTAIGRQSTPEATRHLARLKNGDVLSSVASWPVSISYFTPVAKRADTVPLYEMSFRFYENGITSDLRIDHGEFALKGELTELILLDPNPCPTNKK